MTEETEVNDKVEGIKDVYDDPDVIEHMKQVYTKAEDSDEARALVVMGLAEELGKSVASIRGKLKALGVYIPKVRAAKTKNVTKNTLAERFAKRVEKMELGFVFSDGEIESLLKANKSVLDKLNKILDAFDEV